MTERYAQPTCGDDLREWAIAFTHGDSHGFLGRVVSSDREGCTVTLCPAYSYDAMVASAVVEGKKDRVTHRRDRRILPVECIGSDVTIKVRYRAIVALEDLSAVDRDYFFIQLGPALDIHQNLRAKAIGIAIAKPGDEDGIAKTLGRLRPEH